MSNMKELDSFVGKFRQLWKEGFDASLHVESKAGKASISLTVVLEKENDQNVKPFFSGFSKNWRHDNRYAPRNCGVKVPDLEVNENRKSKSYDTVSNDENVVAAKAIISSSVATVNVMDTDGDINEGAAEAPMDSSDAVSVMNVAQVKPAAAEAENVNLLILKLRKKFCWSLKKTVVR